MLKVSPDEAVKKFETSKEAGKWPQLQKNELIKQLRDRVKNPYSVNQDDTYLCGPAAIIYALIQTDPARYVKICQALFEQGEFGPPETATKPIKASKDLREQARPANIPEIDWMLAATLRESENAIFPVTFKLGQLTLEGAMREWATEVLKYPQTEITTCYRYGELEAIQKAKGAIEKGGVAFLLIDGALLDRGVVIPIPTHWIGVTEPILIGSSRISFNCYSWGKLWIVDKERDAVLPKLYSVVTGWE